MSELNDKIRKVLETIERNALMADSDIDIIKKAFLDAGWVAIPETEVVERVKIYDNQIVCSLCQNRFTDIEDYRLHAQLHSSNVLMDRILTRKKWRQ